MRQEFRSAKIVQTIAIPCLLLLLLLWFDEIFKKPPIFFSSVYHQIEMEITFETKLMLRSTSLVRSTAKPVLAHFREPESILKQFLRQAMNSSSDLFRLYSQHQLLRLAPTRPVCFVISV